MPVQNHIEDPRVSYVTLELNPVENTNSNELGANSETNNNNEIIEQASGAVGTISGANGTISTGTISGTGTNFYHQTTEENSGTYAMIDLDKTHAIAALNAGQSNPSDEGIRRTRHNSTLEGISSFSANGKIIG